MEIQTSSTLQYTNQCQKEFIYNYDASSTLISASSTELCYKPLEVYQTYFIDLLFIVFTILGVALLIKLFKK